MIERWKFVICLYALLINTVVCGNYTNYGDGGWCFGGVDDYIGRYSSAEACWDACYDEYSTDLISVDYWPDGFSTGTSDDNLCYCQDACPCRADSGSGSILLIDNSISTLPDICLDDPVEMDNDVGWCYGGSDYYLGSKSSASNCWDGCYSLYGDNLYAIDYWSSANACYCQDACDCMANVGSGGTLVISSYIASSPSQLPDVCSSTDDDYSDDYGSDDTDSSSTIAGATLAFVVIGSFCVCSIIVYTCHGMMGKPEGRVTAPIEGHAVIEDGGIAMTVRNAPAVLITNDMEVVDAVRVMDTDDGVIYGEVGEVSIDDTSKDSSIYKGEGSTLHGVPIAQASGIGVASRALMGPNGVYCRGGAEANL